MQIHLRTYSGKGFSLVEVLVSLTILLAGIVSIVNFYPLTLRAGNQAAYVSEAVMLAQLKAEEIRRDTTAVNNYVQAIRLLTVPTEPRPFPQEPILTYSFCGVSLLDPIDDPEDPRDDVGVARVIIRYNKSYRPNMEVLYELRFDE